MWNNATSDAMRHGHHSNESQSDWTKNSELLGMAATERVMHDRWSLKPAATSLDLPPTPPESPALAHGFKPFSEDLHTRPRVHRAYTCASSHPAASFARYELSTFEQEKSSSMLVEIVNVPVVLTRAELEHIAALHDGRIPTAGQTASLVPVNAKPLINTGNTGPMVVQEGDWTASENCELLEKLHQAKELAAE
ncbi:hypothetical protein OIV83_004743 [Microbotryomycetes sp. JL201]|nr:hypothetical protein OIV83_004743 [Microbotryomycetes sp. JL201]